MADNIIAFPAHRVTPRNYIAQPYTTADREHALGRIREARSFLQTAVVGSFGWEQASWLLENWQRQLAEIAHADDNVVYLRRA